VARRIVRRIGLHLHEDAAGAVDEERRSDQLARDLVDVPGEERAV
jgi:hypothetical protein